MNDPIMVFHQDNKTKLKPASFFTSYNPYKRKVNLNLKSMVVLNNRFNLSIIKSLN